MINFMKVSAMELLIRATVASVETLERILPCVSFKWQYITFSLNFLRFIFILRYRWFAYMYVCMSHVCLLLKLVRRGC